MRQCVEPATGYVARMSVSENLASLQADYRRGSVNPKLATFHAHRNEDGDSCPS